MAYPTITDQCLDEKHGECPQYVNTPTDPDAVGGGFCLCGCHRTAEAPPVQPAFYEEVRAAAILARLGKENCSCEQNVALAANLQTDVAYCPVHGNNG